MARSIDEQVLEKAMKDSDFRRKLIADPKATLEKEFKVKLPAGVAVQVHEDSDRVRHLVLPGAMKGGVELTDDQLATAAGGLRRSGGSTCPCCTCGVSTHQTIFSQ